jgi:hypothetical protein
MQNNLKEVAILETKTLPQLSKFRQNTVKARPSRYTQNLSTEEMIHRAAKRSVLIPAAFLLCWTPYLFMVLIEMSSNNPSSPSFDHFAGFCCSMTSVVDFFIFAFLNEKFNKGIRELFGYN